jgi:hypothetical protein
MLPCRVRTRLHFERPSTISRAVMPYRNGRRMAKALFPGGAALAGANGCADAIVQRRKVDVPPASTNRNALRLLKALLSNPRTLDDFE